MQVEMLNEEAFSGMTKTEKVSHLFKDGTELLVRHKDGYTICLYLLTNFFVEVWFKDPDRKIEFIEFTDVEKVAVDYENQIELSNLY